MANPLYTMIGNPQTNNLMTRFQQFKQNFKGDPQQMIQQLLDSGKITQSQYNQAIQMAQQLRGLLGK